MGRNLFADESGRNLFADKQTPAQRFGLGATNATPARKPFLQGEQASDAMRQGVAYGLKAPGTARLVESEEPPQGEVAVGKPQVVGGLSMPERPMAREEPDDPADSVLDNIIARSRDNLSQSFSTYTGVSPDTDPRTPDDSSRVSAADKAMTAASNVGIGAAGVVSGAARSLSVAMSGQGPDRDLAARIEDIKSDDDSLLDSLWPGEYLNMGAGPMASPVNIGALSYKLGGKKKRAQIEKDLKKRLANADDPTEGYAYRFGEALDKAARDNLSRDKRLKESFLYSTLPQATGSMLAFMAGTAVMRRPVASVAGKGAANVAPSLTLGAGAESGNTFAQALEETGSFEKAFAASDMAAIGGASEALPIARILDRIDANGQIRKRALDALKSGGEEAFQEFMQSTWGNLNAQFHYDPDRGLFEGAGEGAGAGFTVGAVTQGIASMLFGRHARISPEQARNEYHEAMATADEHDAEQAERAGRADEANALRAQAEKRRQLVTEQPGTAPDAAAQPGDDSLQSREDLSDGQKASQGLGSRPGPQQPDAVQVSEAQAPQQRNAGRRPEQRAGHVQPAQADQQPQLDESNIEAPSAEGAFDPTAESKKSLARDDAQRKTAPKGLRKTDRAARKPWQQPRSAFYQNPDNAGIDHEQAVAQALERGESVAPDVLIDYPDLAETTQQTENNTESEQSADTAVPEAADVAPETADQAPTPDTATDIGPQQATTAVAPETITRGMREDLSDLGYEKADIDAMAPTDANTRIAEQRRKPGAAVTKTEKARQRIEKMRQIDNQKDDIATAVRKLGGINTDIESDWRGRLSHLNSRDKRPGMPGIEQTGDAGLSMDQLAERLAEEGYIGTPEDAYDQGELAELLSRAESGEPVYGNAPAADALEQAARERTETADDVIIDELPDRIEQETGRPTAPPPTGDEVFEPAGSGQAFEDREYEPDWDAPTRGLNDLFYSASEFDPEAAESIMSKGVTDVTVARQLIEVINNGRQEKRQSALAGRQGARESDPRPDGRQAAAQAPQETDAALDNPPGQAPGFSLQGPDRTQAETPAARENQPDLLGDDTRDAQAIADESRTRDARRSPNTDVPADIDGGLFANQSRDIEDGPRLSRSAGQRNNDETPPVSRNAQGAPVRTPWHDLPDAVIQHSDKRLQSDPDYRRAKDGDTDAAYRLVRRLVDPNKIRQMRDALGARRPAVVAVHAEERGGVNQIPEQYAMRIAHALGLGINDTIVQAEKIGRGGSSGFYRLANPPIFNGAVEPGRDYLIVDDTLAQGGTLAALKGHIEANGGHVVLASALSGKRYSAKMTPSAAAINEVRQRHGNEFAQWWQSEFGYGLETLTQSELRYLARVRLSPSESIRDRILAAKQARGDSSRARTDRERDALDRGDAGSGPQASRAIGTEPNPNRPAPEKKPEQDAADVQALRRALAQHLGRDDFTLRAATNLSTDSASAARELAPLFGKRVVFFETDDAQVNAFNGIALPGADVVYLNAEAEVAHTALLGHELTHYLKRERPDLWATLEPIARAEIQNSAEYRRWLDEASAGENWRATDAELQEEMLADFIGDQFLKPSFWTRVMEQSEPSMGRRIAAAVRRFLDNVLRWLDQRGFGGARYFKDIERMRDAAANAFAGYAVDRRQDFEQRARYTASRGGASFEAPASTDNASPWHARFVSLGDQRVPNAQVMADAQDMTGLALDIPIESAELRATVPMRFDADRGVIEVSNTHSMPRPDAVMAMAEELYHGLDVLPSGNSIAASSPRFQPGGDIWSEALTAMREDTALGRFLDYPLGEGMALSTPRQSAELFARLGVLYTGNAEAMRRSMPLAHAAIDEVNNAIRQGNRGLSKRNRRGADASAQVRTHRAPDRQANQGSGTSRENRRTDPGLERLRRQLAKRIGGSRLGRRVPPPIETRRNTNPPGQVPGSLSESPQFSRSRDTADDASPRRRFRRHKPPAKTDPFFEENQRLRDQDRRTWDRAGQIIRRQLAPAGLLPRNVFDAKIARDSQFEVVEFDTRHLVGTLESAVKADYKKSWAKLDSQQKTLLNEALGGQVSDAIPRRTREALVAMRRYIDHLSSEYITTLGHQADNLLRDAAVQASVETADIRAAMEDTQDPVDAARRVLFDGYIENGVSPDVASERAYAETGAIADALGKAATIQTISGNLGRYVHRSYRAFDDPKWNEKLDTETIQAARDLITSRYTENGETDAEAARLAEVTLNEILKNGTAYDNLESFIAEGKLGAKDLSVLKQRQQIAPEIRALLGEYQDPRINFAKSATKMGRLIWNDRFLHTVREQGMGVFLFEGADRPPQATAQIAADGSESYAPLNGLWTYPEVAQSFADALGKENIDGWYKAIIQLNGAVKFGKTVMSPTTAARNWQSAMFFALANGHFNLGHMAKSLSGLREYFQQQGSGAKLAYLRKLKELGVVYDTPYAGEMMRLLDDASTERDLLNNTRGIGVKKALDYAQKFYQYGDDFWKIIGFENEKRSLQRTGMSEAEAETEAAERIRNTYPTYSMVPRVINSLRRFPLAGTFVSFPAEILRTTGNMLYYVNRDLQTPGRRRLGLKRVAGMAVVGGVFAGMQALSKAWFDIDDEEEEATRDLAAPWNENSNLLFIGRDKAGALEYFDMSFLDPYNILKRPVNAMLRDEPWQDQAVSAVSELVLPFLGADITAETIGEVVWNKRAGTGTAVYNENASVPAQIGQAANHLRKSLQPGLASNLERTWKAIKGQYSPSGRQYKLTDEGLAWVGWRKSTLDPKVGLYYRSFEFGDALSDAQKGLYRTLRSPNDISPSELRGEYAATLKMRRQAFKDMGEIVSAARKSGMSNNAIGKVLSSSSVSKKNIDFLLRGEVPPWRPTNAAARYGIRKAGAVFDAERARKIRNRFKRVMQIDPASLEK